MEQVFKMSHHTVTYHGGGKYTLKADAGFILQSATGEQRATVETKDYTQWIAVSKPKTKKGKKSK